MHKKRKDWSKDMGMQRINRLFELAYDEFKNHPERSNRYVQLARRIGMRYRIRLPREMKQKICKHCHVYLVEGSNARTRLQGTHITTTCIHCGKQMRQPY